MSDLDKMRCKCGGRIVYVDPNGGLESECDSCPRTDMSEGEAIAWGCYWTLKEERNNRELRFIGIWSARVKNLNAKMDASEHRHREERHRWMDSTIRLREILPWTRAVEEVNADLFAENDTLTADNERLKGEMETAKMCLPVGLRGYVLISAAVKALVQKKDEMEARLLENSRLLST